MKLLDRVMAAIVWIALAVVFGTTEAGHESPVYPSFYPQEIRVETVDPSTAGSALAEGRIQAYVGTTTGIPNGAWESVKFVETLGSYLVLSVNPESPLALDADARCTLVQRVISALAGHEEERFRLHPYPINPLHADYFQHFDLAGRAKDRFEQPASAGADSLRVRASGALAERLVRSRWTPAQSNWDVSLEEVGLEDLIAEHRIAINGWMGPPWLKEGWFHAYSLLAWALTGAEVKADARTRLARLQRGDYQSGEERINVERDLVKILTSQCRAAIAGYATRRWHYSDEYSRGIENIAYDSHTGFHSAIFIRTVKLKDFPWNGWLTLGVPDAPAAAWNPFGGFTDETGRLIWLTLGDPALFPEPYNRGWNLNRIGGVKGVAR